MKMQRVAKPSEGRLRTVWEDDVVRREPLEFEKMFESGRQP